jgi:hypothetical protein
MFVSNRDGVTEEWRRLRNEELNDLHCSSNIVRVMKSRRIRWVWHVARRGRREAYTGFWWGNMRERDHLGDLGVDGRIIINLTILLINWLGRYARVVDHLAVKNVAQGAPLGGGSTLHPTDG